MTVEPGKTISYQLGNKHNDFVMPGSKKIDLILRPSPKAATNTVGIRKFWAQPIILRDVKIEQP